MLVSVKPRTIAPVVIVCAAFWLGYPRIAAAQQALVLTPLADTQLRIDGDVREWRGVRFTELGDSTDSSLEYALAYDAQALYVGLRIFDNQLVRSNQPSPAEDAVVVTLVMPRAVGAPISTELWLYAGVSGTQASEAALGSAGAKPNKDKRITIVEGPLSGAQGYVLEARVPWETIDGSRNFLVARGAIRLHDVDGKAGARASEIASARADRPSRLPPLAVVGGPNAALDMFLSAKQLTTSSVRHDFLGDVAGDARLERVIVAGTFAVMAGPDIEGGSGFHFMDLPVPLAAGVLDAELRDLTGDAKGELLIRLRQQNDRGTRELLQVLDLTHGQPKWIFAIELRKQTSDGSVDAKLDIKRAERGESPKLEVSIGKATGPNATGPNASNFNEQPAKGVEGILLPWGPWEKRVYRWDGTRFAVLEQQENRALASQEKVAIEATMAADQPPRVTYAQPPGTDELIAAFRESQGIEPSVKPRFEQNANVAEDARLESLMLFGKSLLVIGKGYRDGTGYFFYALPVRDGTDIQRVWNRDVTGDGRRELFVRHKQMIGDVQREILLGFTFTDSGMQQILAVEVRRSQASNSIDNVVELVREHGRASLRIAPGLAHGWDARSYPYVAESSDGVGPLLLPWNDGAVRYRLLGQVLVPQSERTRGQ